MGSISSPAEIKAILEVLATVIQTEAAENNRIQLESGDGGGGGNTPGGELEG